MEAINLEIEEINIVTIPIFLNNMSKIYLRPNQHVVVLFIKSANGKDILDFHFVRFDEMKGWSEKYRHQNVNFFNAREAWPNGFYISIGAFVISK